MKPTLRSILEKPETMQPLDLNADEPTVLLHFNVPVAVVLSWETWTLMKQALEAK